MMTRLTAATVAILAVAGCRAPTPTSETPMLRWVRTVSLGDSVGRGIGWPAGLSVAGNGDFFLVDLGVPAVLAFDVTGRFTRRYGGVGDGPGELRGPRSPLVLNDSLLVVADAAHQTLEVFERRSGRYLQRVRLPTRADVLAAGPGGTLLLGALNLATGSSYLRWTPFADSVAAEGSIPPEYADAPRVAAFYRRVFVAALDSSSVVAVEGSAHLGVELAAGSITWHLVPTRLRSPPPPALEARLAETPQDSIFTLFAFVHALGRLADGSLAIVHQQLRFLGGRRPGADRFPLANRLYLTVIDLSGRRACIDAEVPTAGEMVAQPSVRGDSLYVLEQRTDSVEATTAISTYAIDTTGCRWTPLSASGDP